jgi:uncharacterized membrane protein HdeD (DUF308 family)
VGELREAIGNWAQKAAKNAGWIVALGVVTVIAGFLAMGSPMASGAAVVVFIGVAMAIAGVARSLLGFLLLREWPLSGLWAIGTLVGVNLLFSGFSLISVGSAARGLAKKLE